MSILSSDSNAVQPADDATTQIVQAVQQECQAIHAQLKTVEERLSQLTVREAELRAVIAREAELEAHQGHLVEVLSGARTRRDVSAAIDDAELHLDPCPYTIVDGLLPAKLYKCLLRGIPPVELFLNRPGGRKNLNIPFELAPMYAQRVWRYMVDEIVSNIILPRIIEKFREPIDAWIIRNWPDVPPASIPLHSSGGRIMFNRRGYRILPHRDPKWGFITCILFLARPEDSEDWGTQIYAVDEDQEAKNAAPYWIDPKRCRLVEDVAFRPNRLLVFLNSTGAHGAHIPDDAQPPTLERYIYQFRIGPPKETIAMLKSRLSEEQQPLWAGKGLVDY